MKLSNQTDGSLRLILEDENDWILCELLLNDARGKGDDWLAKQMGLFVDEDDWDEFVVPEISQQYNGQIETVEKSLTAAKERAEDEEGELIIDKVIGEEWYGVLNQARLSLEGRWKLSAAEEKGEFDDQESADPEKASAFFRSRLYCFLQAQIIENVLS
jgi:hypothetical protein